MTTVWEDVVLGRSGARVQRGRGVHRKHTPAARLEAATLSWLRGHGLPAAEVLDVDDDVLVTWTLPGVPASQPWPPHQQARVIDALVDVTRALHALPVGDCPFDRTLTVVATEARAAAATDRVDLDDLDDERRGWTAGELVAAVEERLAAMTAREVPVVTHGDWCLPNVLVDQATLKVVGIVDTARLGRADRCVDLALMSRSLGSPSLNPQWGPDAAPRFLDALYLDEGEREALEFYRLLDELA